MPPSATLSVTYNSFFLFFSFPAENFRFDSRSMVLLLSCKLWHEWFHILDLVGNIESTRCCWLYHLPPPPIQSISSSLYSISVSMSSWGPLLVPSSLLRQSAPCHPSGPFGPHPHTTSSRGDHWLESGVLTTLSHGGIVATSWALTSHPCLAVLLLWWGRTLSFVCLFTLSWTETKVAMLFCEIEWPCLCIEAWKTLHPWQEYGIGMQSRAAFLNGFWDIFKDFFHVTQHVNLKYPLLCEVEMHPKILTSSTLVYSHLFPSDFPQVVDQLGDFEFILAGDL